MTTAPLLPATAEIGSRNDQARRLVALRLAILFGTFYFVQGIAEPSEGLIAQPVRSLLREAGQTSLTVAAVSAALGLPWVLKPLFGLASDFYPLAGRRRKSYLILATTIATVSLLGLYLWPPSPKSAAWMAALLVVPTMAVAMSDVVIDALMVERGGALGLTGRLQAVQWGATYAATIFASVLGGQLTEASRQPLGFLICGLLSAVSLALAWTVVREPRQAASHASLRGHLGELWAAFRVPSLVWMVLFVVLWSFNPASSTVLQEHLVLGTRLLSHVEFGYMRGLEAAGAVVGSMLYGWLSTKLGNRSKFQLSIGAGIIANVLYLGVFDRLSAFAISVLIGAVYLTGLLAQLDLAAQVCPPQVAGTVFACLMGASNLGLMAGIYAGGLWYAQLGDLLGAVPAFNWLVIFAAGATALCWLLPVQVPQAAITSHSTG